MKIEFSRPFGLKKDEISAWLLKLAWRSVQQLLDGVCGRLATWLVVKRNAEEIGRLGGKCVPDRGDGRDFDWLDKAW